MSIGTSPSPIFLVYHQRDQSLTSNPFVKGLYQRDQSLTSKPFVYEVAIRGTSPFNNSKAFILEVSQKRDQSLSIQTHYLRDQSLLFH